jgi:hypothetical protein
MTHASTDLPHHRILEYRLLIHWKGAGIGIELPDIVGAAVKLLEFRGSAASCKGSGLRAWRHTVLLSVGYPGSQPSTAQQTHALRVRFMITCTTSAMRTMGNVMGDGSTNASGTPLV